MTTDIVLIDEQTIKEKMYYIRGEYVMIDSDLAKIYGYTTKVFNQQVKNNIEKFENDFMLQLTSLEYREILRSKNLTLELKQGKYSKYLPYAFTEQGIKILGTIMRKSGDITNKILKNFNTNYNYPIVSDALKIKDLIHEIDGKQVILDFDIAKLYKVETKRINEAVKNNPDKFPERFSFVLSDNLWSKFSTAKLRNMSRTNPRVFTEQGVAMLATILKSKRAIKTSIDIMDAFVMMRKFIKGNLLEQQYINNMVLENRENIKEISNDVKVLQEAFDKLEEKELKNKLFINGQKFDSYLEIIKTLNKSNKEIIIIDNYADITLLEIISNIDKSVLLITNKSLLKEIDIKKYNEQYHNLTIIN